MIRRITLVVIAVMLILPQIRANQITIAHAKTVAHNFYFERFNQDQLLDYSDVFIANVYSQKVDSENVIYFVNFRENGWVAVSASDAVIPIVAYSFKGSYNNVNAPPNFLSWISQYEKQISFAINQNMQPTSDTRDLWVYYLTGFPNEPSRYNAGRNIEPLLTTTWDQGLYYNEMCPADAGGPGGHCYVGCVPTTMGQLCNYFRFPETGTGSYSYQCPPYGELSADFENSVYNWNEMPSSVVGNSLATAQILYHLGVSCDLVYGPDGSGMYNHKAAYALRTHFKYSPETEYVYRDSTNLNWDSLLIAHLDRKMPMYYAGWSVPNINGHAFVCDGYQDSSYFHFNWGWSGSYDGYFYTSNLNPGGSNFNLAQEVIINCFPDTINYQYPVYCQGADTLRSISGTIDDGSGPLNNYIDNQLCSWLISPIDSVNYITLQTIKFDVAENDTLFIYDGNSDDDELIGAFSGINIPENVTSSGDELFIVFQTDSENTAEGLLIGYSSNIPQFCSNLMLTLPTDTLADGSGPASYQNLTTCLWMIQPEEGLEITLNFLEFDTEADFDILKIYDGSEQIGAFSGDELPPSLTATSGLMSIFFTTNLSVTKAGWKAYYTTSTVSTNDVNIRKQVSIFPNPASKVINIELNENVKFITAKVFDIYGKEVATSQGEECSFVTINTSELPAGMYITTVSYENVSISRKVIIRSQ